MTGNIVKRKANLTWRVIVLGATGILVLMALVLFRIMPTREQNIVAASENAQELTRTLESGVSATLQSADLILDFVSLTVAEIDRSHSFDVGDLPNKFIRLAQPWQFIQSVGYIDPTGRSNRSVLRDPVGTLKEYPNENDVSQRDTFMSHASQTREKDRLFLSEIRPGYATNTPVIIMSKGIWSDDGRFLGVASVGIRQDAIAAVFSALVPKTNGAAMLFRRDGTLLLALPESGLIVGQSYQDSTLFRSAIPQTAEGVYDQSNVNDGIARRLAYRAAPNYPIVVAISVPLADILAEWQRSSDVLLTVTLLSAALIAILTLSLARKIQAEQASKEALRDSEGRLRDLLECSSDFVWESDAAGRIISFTGPGSEVFPDMVGQRGADFNVELSQQNDLTQLLECQRLQEPYRNLIFATRGRQGEIRWVRSSANPKFDDNGQFQGFRGVGTDVTETRRQRDLIEAQRKTEALGRLASGLAHEINNLLQPILIYSSAASANRHPDDTMTYFSRIRRAAESASAIVRNVLAYARRSPPRRENIDLIAVVRETVEVMSAHVPEHVAIKLDIPPMTPWVVVDRTGLAQAVTNLLSNALQAVVSKPSDGTISIAASETFVHPPQNTTLDLAPGRYCRLTVCDNGPGIPSGEIDKVFDPFFTTKPQGQGTGLGLSVVAGLIKSWGGAVTVTSIPGEKTEFALYLPVVERQLQAAQ